MAKKTPPLPSSVAWDILWRNYIKALRAPQTSANLDRVERLKKQIDSFDTTWLKMKDPSGFPRT